MYIICHFSLVPFNNFSFSLMFVSLITVCLGMFLLGFILAGTLPFLDLGGCFLSHVREVFDYNLFKYFSRSFLSSPSGTPMMQMLVRLMLSQRSLRVSSFFFIYIYYFPFSLFVSVYVYASLCDFVCIAFLLPFVPGFCLSLVD